MQQENARSKPKPLKDARNQQWRQLGGVLVRQSAVWANQNRESIVGGAASCTNMVRNLRDQIKGTKGMSCFAAGLSLSGHSRRTP